MSTKALRKELLAAIAMVIVAAIALSGSTYAWFAVNNRVTVTGMEVTTRVSNNLYIADMQMSDADKNNDEDFKSALHQVVTGQLEPVSTINGLDFFYTDATNNVSATGASITESYIALNTDQKAPSADQITAFKAMNGTEANIAGYVDYVFELKAVNATDAAVPLKLTKMDLVYKGLTTTEKAFRAAVFIQKYDDTNHYTAISPETLPAASSILKQASAANFQSGKAVETENALGTVLTPDTAVSVDVTANKTEYFKVVVRLWLEGEDTTCNVDTFANLKQGWALDLAFDLGGSTGTITSIGGDTVAATADGATGTVTLTSGSLSNGETPASYQWYDAATGAALVGKTAQTFTADATGNYFCQVTTTEGNVYYTAPLALTVAP